MTNRIPQSQGILLLLMFIFPLVIVAQDNHYESTMLGPRNAALANAGIARFEDQTAVFMNPATLSDATGSSFNFNAITGGLSNVKFKNGLGEGLNLKSAGFSVLPNMASGVIKPKKNEKDWVLGYALFHRFSDRILLTDRRETETNVINDTESPGNEYYSGQYHLDKDLDEVNLVLGVGWSLSSKVNIGFSQTFGYHSESYRDYFNGIATPLPGSSSAIDLISARQDVFLTYWKGFTQTMVGMTAKLGKWDLGLVAQTPTFSVMGRGQMMADLGLTNIRIGDNLTTPRRSIRGNGYYAKLKATYKTPWYFGLGLSRAFGAIRWYGALKYYSAVKNYTVMSPGEATFLLPPTQETAALTENLLRVWAANKSVLNWSVAGDWKVSEKRSLLFSFASNNHYFENVPGEKGFSIPKKVFDLYQISVGTKLNFTTSEWVVSVRYAFGKNDHVRQPYSFYQPTEAGLLNGTPGYGTLSASSLYLALNYTFKFGTKGK
jgi:hypothetical protein